MPIRACIFDMDDLLVRSGPLWRTAESALLDHLGGVWSSELAGRYKGMNTLDVAATIHAALQPSLPVAACQNILRSRLITEFTKGIEPMPGAVDLVHHLHGRYPLALASGSPPEAITLALDQLGLRPCFAHIISSESVPRGKPHPDVFLAAAELIQANPVDCVVFEDSLIGVRAARAAAMYCYAVPSCHPTEIQALATCTLSSLAQAIALL